MSSAFAFGPFRLIPASRTLYRDGNEIAIGSRAFDTLVALAERSGEVVTPRDIMAVAWHGLVVGDSNVRVQIANLRKILGCGVDGVRYITSVAGRGYCFVATVEPIDGADEGPSPASAVSESVVYVDLGVAPDGDDLYERLSSAVGYQAEEPRSIRGLASFLVEHRIVVILDNFDHVISAAARLCLQLFEETRDASCCVLAGKGDGVVVGQGQ